MVERARATDAALWVRRSAVRCAATSADEAAAIAVPGPRRRRRPRRAQGALVGHQVTPVGGQRPRGAAPLDREPGAGTPRPPGAARARVPLTVTAARRARARSSPSTVVSSTSAPSATRAPTSSRWIVSTVIDCSSTPVRAAWHVGEPGGQEKVVRWSLTPGEFQVSISSSQRGRDQAGLLGQLAPGGFERGLAVLVQRPGRDLEHQRPTAGRYWRTMVTVPSSCTGTTATAPGVAHRLALEGLARRGRQVQPVHPEQPGPEELLLRERGGSRGTPLR